MQAQWQACGRGARSVLPILFGTVPFGVVYGAAAVSAGIPASLAIAMSSVLFAGSAQVVIVQMVGASVPALIIVLAAVLLNVRHLLYSASLAPYTRHLSRAWQWVLAYLLVDESYVVVIHNYTRARDAGTGHWFFLGAGATLWSAWQVATVAGVLLGEAVPPAWGLEFAIPLTFIALIVPTLTTRANLAAAGSAAVLVLLLAAVPLKIGLLVAMLGGTLVGALVARRTAPPGSEQPTSTQRGGTGGERTNGDSLEGVEGATPNG